MKNHILKNTKAQQGEIGVPQSLSENYLNIYLESNL